VVESLERAHLHRHVRKGTVTAVAVVEHAPMEAGKTGTSRTPIKTALRRFPCMKYHQSVYSLVTPPPARGQCQDVVDVVYFKNKVYRGDRAAPSSQSPPPRGLALDVKVMKCRFQFKRAQRYVRSQLFPSTLN
jgi:hypothetical protein